MESEKVCGYCLKRLSRPLRTHCGHVLCGDCIDGHHTVCNKLKAPHTCPFCRAAMQSNPHLPSVETAAPVVSEYHLALLESDTLRAAHEPMRCTHKDCTVANEKPLAALVCTKCGPICDVCVAAHPKRSFISKHSLRPLPMPDEANLNHDVEIQSDYCKVHGQPFHSACKTCKPIELLCQICETIHQIRNPDHKTASIRSSIAPLNAELERYTKDLQVSLDDKRSILQDLYVKRLSVEDELAQTTTKIRERFAKLHAELDEREKEIMSIVQSTYETKTKSAYQYEYDLEIHCNYLQHALMLQEEGSHLMERTTKSFKIPTIREAVHAALTRKPLPEASFSPLNLPSADSIQMQLNSSDFLALAPQSEKPAPVQPIKPSDSKLPQVTSFGSIKHSIGDLGSGAKQFDNPRQLAIHPRTRELFIADEGNHRIQILDMNLQPVERFGTPGRKDGQFANPYGVAISTDASRIAVFDQTNARVQVFDGDLSHLFSFGSKGTMPGQFAANYALLQYNTFGELIVCECSTQRIQLFDAEGRILRVVLDSSDAHIRGRSISSMALTRSGDLFLMSIGDPQVKIFTQMGRFLSSFPVDPMANWTSLSVGPNGGFIVSSYGDDVIVFYSRTGARLHTISHPKPWAIAYSDVGILYVTDRANHAVTMYQGTKDS
eukprot:TRINITY_DN11134_c0_g1_i1.p1 TRINITY_DN11134_c0_g1~~TRINITY_DN11134_c0_g1_i1.p1  ORF type:complete len:663 (+),score=117.12 TRINITY_DN11134_c0_g1_i1:65-2053(+)